MHKTLDMPAAGYYCVVIIKSTIGSNVKLSAGKSVERRRNPRKYIDNRLHFIQCLTMSDQKHITRQFIKGLKHGGRRHRTR